MQKIISQINQSDCIDLDLTFKIIKKINTEFSEDESRKLLILILDKWDDISENCIPIWTDLVESQGFYPYLEKYKTKMSLESTSALVRKEFFKSDYIDNIYYHDEQKDILKKFSGGKNMVVSAPTSFGKSLLIEEIVASKKYKNIIIIQPTLALLDETRKKLSKYNDYYKLIVKTNQFASTSIGNIFLFTAERVLEYKELPHIDFLVLDEFYKLSTVRDDERSDSLNNAVYKLFKKRN